MSGLLGYIARGGTAAPNVSRQAGREAALGDMFRQQQIAESQQNMQLAQQEARDEQRQRAARQFVGLSAHTLGIQDPAQQKHFYETRVVPFARQNGLELDPGEDVWSPETQNALQAALARDPETRKMIRDASQLETMRFGESDLLVGAGPGGQEVIQAQARRAPPAPGAVIQNYLGENKYVETEAAAASEANTQLRNAGAEASEMVTNLEQMGLALDRLGDATGPIQAASLPFRAAIKDAFGVDIGDVETQEQLRGQAGRLVLDAMSKQKGPQTDQDRAYIASTMPGLQLSPETNRRLVTYQRGRARLTAFMSQALDNAQLEGNTAEERFRSAQEVQRVARSVPAAFVRADGRSNTFEDFYQANKLRYPNKTGQQIVEEWIAVVPK